MSSGQTPESVTHFKQRDFKLYILSDTIGD